MRTISFYSYKGGTGRTLLVANVGAMAARLGKSVVMVDLDLEAPGLPYKFAGLAELLAERPGVVQWMTESTRPKIDEMALHIGLESPFQAGGSLTLIPAGPAPSLEYMRGMRILHEGPLAGDSAAAIKSLLDLRDEVEKQFQPDLLLLDARTGITTTNAITTRVLADDVVALTLDTDEQREGTRAVLRSLAPLSRSTDEASSLGLFVTVSRLPDRLGADVGSYKWGVEEHDTAARMRRFLSEPAHPLSTTLSEFQLLLLHNDPFVARDEKVLLAGQLELESAALHLDYLAIVAALLGQDEMDRLADAAIAEANDGRGKLERATFFGRVGRILQARPASQPRDDSSNSLAEEAPVERVKILRTLATNNRTRLPDLAQAAVELARAQTSVGARREAAESFEEAVQAYQLLEETEGSEYLTPLIGAMNEWSAALRDAGDQPGALTAAQSAAALAKHASLTDLGGSRPLFASTMVNLAACYFDVKDFENGLAPIKDGVDLYRLLAAENAEGTGRFQTKLAEALDVFGVLHLHAGNSQAAVAAAVEAVDIYRALVASETDDRHRMGMAHALNNLGNHYRLSNALPAARDSVHEATMIYRELAAEDPERHLIRLARAQEHLSVVYWDMQRVSESITALEEAAHFERDLAVADPARYGRVLASSLNELAGRYIALRRYSEAFEVAYEAYGHVREFDSDLLAAKVELNLATCSVGLGRFDDALRFGEAAFQHMQELNRPPRARDMLPYLAQAANVRAMANLGTGNSEAAREMATSAVSSLRLYYQDLTAHPIPISEALLVLTETQCAAGDPGAAVESATEAVALLSGSRGKSRDHLMRLANAFNALADAYAQHGESASAAAALREAQEISKEALGSEGVAGKYAGANRPNFHQMVKALAETNPAAAIAMASARLEVALREVLKRGNPSAKRMGIGQLVGEAVRQGILQKDEELAAQSLLPMRAKALHENVATQSDATKFGELAFQIAIAVRLAAGETSANRSDPL